MLANQIRSESWEWSPCRVLLRVEAIFPSQRIGKEGVMYVTLVQVHVKSEHLEEFIAATKANHEGSVNSNWRNNLEHDLPVPLRDGHFRFHLN